MPTIPIAMSDTRCFDRCDIDGTATLFRNSDASSCWYDDMHASSLASIKLDPLLDFEILTYSNFLMWHRCTPGGRVKHFT